MTEDLTPTESVAPTDTEASTPDYEAETAKWKAMARKHEQQAKENAAAAKQLAEIQEAQKTAEQKAAEASAEAAKRATQAEQELARLRVAMRKGLTETQARRLIGDNEEALEADADELLASFRVESPAPEEGDTPSPTRPKEKLKSGSTAADVDDVSQLTADDIRGWGAAEIVKAQNEGRLNQLLGIT